MCRGNTKYNIANQQMHVTNTLDWKMPIINKLTKKKSNAKKKSDNIFKLENKPLE